MFRRGDSPSDGGVTNRRYTKTWKWFSICLFLSVVGFVTLTQSGSAGEGDTQEQSLAWARGFVAENESILCVRNVDGNSFFWIGGKKSIKLGHRVWSTPPEDHRVSWSFIQEGVAIGFPGDQFRVIENRVHNVGAWTALSVVQVVPVPTGAEKGYTGMVRFAKYPHPGLKPPLGEEANENLPVVAQCDVKTQ